MSPSAKQTAVEVLATGFAILALGACYQQGMAAWAFSLAGQGTPDSLDRASRIAPLNAVFWCERGILRLDGPSRDVEQFLKRSLELNAFEVDALIALGLLAEASARMEDAEEYLTRASSLSRRFKPKWALAFFYFRRGNFDQFWPAASAAANVEAADAKPVFVLAHQTHADPVQFAELLHLQSQHALASYAGFLLEQKGAPALTRVALRIDPVPESRPLLLAAVERSISENRSEEAVQLWNHLRTGTGIPHLSPGAGVSLTNGSFAASEGRGFEWRLIANRGIDVRAGAPGDLRIEFSGRQTETGTLLEQFVPVLPGRPYCLSFQYGVDGMTGSTGLYWQIFQSAIPLTPSMPLAPLREGTGSFSFLTGPDIGLIRVALRYKREPGTTRVEGTLVLRSAALDLL